MPVVDVLEVVDVQHHDQLQAASSLDMPVEVSPSGFYDWKDRPPSPRAVANQQLLARIHGIHQASDATYGRPRILVELQEAGERVGKNRVARMMRAHGIRG